MRDAPPYSADRFPADFVLSALTGLAVAAVTGPATWWFALRYVQRTYPGHVEMRSAAIVAGVADGLLSAVLAFGLCFAVRIWLFERRERRRSDDLLRATLSEMTDSSKHEGEGDGEPPFPPR